MSLYFTREHEWIRLEGDVATVGISDHAQQALGDIVFAEVPEAGKRLAKGAEAEGNAAVADDPALINRDPEGDGWFFKMKLDDPGEVDGLMDEAAYREWVKTL